VEETHPANPYEAPKSRLEDAAAAADPALMPRIVKSGLTLLWIAVTFDLLRLPQLWSRLGPDHWMSAPVFSVVMIMVLIGVWNIVMIGLQRNWARILFAITFVPGTVFSLRTLAETLHHWPIAGVTGLLQILVQSIALLLLFTPEANAWFRRS
jgi:hypothetical protein